MRTLTLTLLLSTATLAYADIPRTADGKPDLTGTYDTATLTPMQRPEWLGETETLYPWVADLLSWGVELLFEYMNRDSDPDREAPEQGGDGNNIAGAGGVGGYNTFWVDPGTEFGRVDGMVPTSILYDPPNGRFPELQPGMDTRFSSLYATFGHENTGEATWLEHDGPGPFDGPESLAPSERCLISFAPTVPTLPSLYNNYKRIVQTETHVMILQEMVHDARIIRLGGDHVDTPGGQWLGDSVGHWDGDTLVVRTRNFREVNGLYGADENLVVTERFTLQEDGNLHYDFTVRDPTVWQDDYSGRFTWRAQPQDKLYEYACHEANYSMGNVLRGARLLEREWREARGAGAR